MPELVRVERLKMAYGDDVVLSGVDMSIEAGEIVTIVGPNGSGKSTLLKAMVGTELPRGGEVVRKQGLRIGYVPQRMAVDALLPLAVSRFLSLARVRKADAIGALEKVGAERLLNRQLSDLSGGQLQRVLLARALASEPELLLLDEPTQGLDQPGSAALYRLIEQLRDDLGCGIVMVSHELHVVMSASDRVICLNGHVCCQGHPDVVASAPEYRALFGTGTQGALALYRHEHTHSHEGHDHDHHHHDHA
ncbi:MAG: metal ABC transporter ATP-binding protein [Rhodobacteraceae bacterium]|nr:metal ABC transporter ATP-binding protein [Paracoccaceae bacterium]